MIESATLALPNELLKNRTVIISGGTGDINFSVSKVLQNAGTNVLITTLDSTRLHLATSFFIELGNKDVQIKNFPLSELIKRKGD